MEQILESFQELGATFVLQPEEIASRLQGIKALVFDWDGVFNDGRNRENSKGSFAEADAMGVNLLRLGFWLRDGQIPFTGIITGRNNPIAFRFAEREHLHFVYFGVKHKIEALNHLCESRGLKPEEVAFVFDDALDLSMAAACGLRFMVRRPAGPLFLHYVQNENLADYISASPGDGYAVREVSELILTALGKGKETLDVRRAYDETYIAYRDQRKALLPDYFSMENGSLLSVSRPDIAG